MLSEYAKKRSSECVNAGINQLERAVTIIMKQWKWNQNRSQKAIVLTGSIKTVNAVLRKSVNNTFVVGHCYKMKSRSQLRVGFSDEKGRLHEMHYQL